MAALPGGSTAEAQIKAEPSIADLCGLVEQHARGQGLPPSFFTRLIWKESRFNRNAVSPKGAQGIAQFMPGTAAERGLSDPFDPDQAIPHSARFLRELHDKFGNIGLAAAAYNAGPRRVEEWLDGRGSLPAETQDYVRWITGRAAMGWKPADDSGETSSGELAGAELGCPEFVTLAARGSVIGPKPTRRPAPEILQVSRHAGHKLMTANTAPASSARPHKIGDEPTVSRLTRAKGKALYAVQAGVQSHRQARNECKRLRASGSHCVVVVR